MNIDFDSLSTKELVHLNHRIVELIRNRRQQETYKHLAKFSIGDHVEFTGDDGEMIRGIVARVNRKTISIDAYDPHGHWRVSPAIVSKVVTPITGEALTTLRLVPKEGEIFN